MTAAASVLGTCELLEQILLQLPLRQLLLAQRISKTFHELIQDSPSIRRALFLPRASDTAVESHVGDVDGKRRRRKQKEYEQQKTRWRFPGSAQNVKLMVNPFLTTYVCLVKLCTRIELLY